MSSAREHVCAVRSHPSEQCTMTERPAETPCMMATEESRTALTCFSQPELPSSAMKPSAVAAATAAVSARSEARILWMFSMPLKEKTMLL